MPRTSRAANASKRHRSSFDREQGVKKRCFLTGTCRSQRPQKALDKQASRTQPRPMRLRGSTDSRLLNLQRSPGVVIVCETDTQTDMLLTSKSAICVQEFDDSQNSAIHMTYHILPCSSSNGEPRYPLLKVVIVLLWGIKGQKRHRAQGGSTPETIICFARAEFKKL